MFYHTCIHFSCLFSRPFLPHPHHLFSPPLRGFFSSTMKRRGREIKKPISLNKSTQPTVFFITFFFLILKDIDIAIAGAERKTCRSLYILMENKATEYFQDQESKDLTTYGLRIVLIPNVARTVNDLSREVYFPRVNSRPGLKTV